MTRGVSLACAMAPRGYFAHWSNEQCGWEKTWPSHRIRASHEEARMECMCEMEQPKALVWSGGAKCYKDSSALDHID